MHTPFSTLPTRSRCSPCIFQNSSNIVYYIQSVLKLKASFVQEILYHKNVLFATIVIFLIVQTTSSHPLQS